LDRTSRAACVTVHPDLTESIRVRKTLLFSASLYVDEVVQESELVVAADRYILGRKIPSSSGGRRATASA
jgi:hypothetical protein